MEPQRVPLPELISKYDRFLLDCDGVIWRGTEAIPGAAKTIQTMLDAGKEVILVTNATRKSRADIQDKLKHCSLPHIESENIYAANIATAKWLKLNHPEIKKVYMACEPGCADAIRAEGFEVVGEEDRDRQCSIEGVEALELDPEVGAVVTGICLKFNYQILSMASEYLTRGAKFIMSNPDIFNIVDGKREMAGGVIAEMLSVATDRKPEVVCGKPNMALYEVMALEKGWKEEEKERTLMVGDKLVTDIQFGINSGIDTLLVESGCHSEKDFQCATENPNNVRPTWIAASFGSE